MDFLELVGEELPRRIVLVAAGGTAMTLLKVKASSRDIDFTGPGEDIEAFRQALKRVPHGMKVDLYRDGQVFTQSLPSDYLEQSVAVKQLEKIDLRALNPLDIVVSKIGRLNDRDEKDIADCIKKFKLTKAAVKKRAAKVGYAGNEENYTYNLEIVLKNFFRPA